MTYFAQWDVSGHSRILIYALGDELVLLDPMWNGPRVDTLCSNVLFPFRTAAGGKATWSL